jgi:predicted metalloprotease
MFLFGINPLGGGGGSGVVSPQQQTQINAAGAKRACSVDAASTFSCKVLASTEDTWAKLFQQSGQSYRPAGLILFSGRGQSGCGAAQSAMGPFYCPSDQRIYLDTDFFRELSQRFRAAGDFAQAYVIAHEVGHHIQYLTGVADKVRAGQQRGSEAEGNALQVRMELQADCYAGVWAAQNRDRLDPGDVEEGLRAAQAIGDDTLQKAAGQTPVPDSFTHGTSAERMAWLKRGIDSGDPARCDTFSGPIG